jgi:rhodanese-related sulfurtransferase/thioredoxin-related protein
MARFRSSHIIVNVLLTVSVVSFLASVGWRFWRDRSFAVAAVSADGKTISIAGLDFSASKQTLLLALDKNCRFCAEESPFYQEVIEAARAKGVRVVIAFPHSIEDGKQYLAEHHIAASDVVKVRFKSLGVAGTPTLFLLDSAGTIIGKWFGTLPEPVHNYVIRILGSNADDIRKDSSPFLTWGSASLPPGVKLDTVNLQSVIILDIADRKEFAREHIVGSVNLPVDEVYARALNEVPGANMIVIFSRHPDPIQINNAMVSLRRAGFSNITWLDANLEQCQAAGVEVSTAKVAN